ncbi:MAG: hypothetical protein O7D94_04755, partial [Planctomycetota bacterium]|nr:hypothetical protein [Planctomycetota bacterium]
PLSGECALVSFWSSILGPRKSFEGGLFLPEQKSVTARLPIETLRVDGPLHVPLRVTRDLGTEAVVAMGDRVLRGQRLSRPTEWGSVGVHAPTSGEIVGFEPAWTAEDGFVPGVRLEPDGADSSVPTTRGWEEESFMVQLAEKGVVCPRPRGSAHARIQSAIAAGATDLIVNAMETEPFLTADLRTLVEESGRLIDATCEIADAMGARRVLFVLPFRHRRVVRRIENEAIGRHVEVVPLANKYPQCNDVVLIKTLLDLEVPPGGCDIDVGAAILPLAMVRAVADATLDDRPLTHTVITIAGDIVEQAGTYRVAVGTPVRRLAERVGTFGPIDTVVSGGPLTGTAIDRDDAVITAVTRAILFFGARTRPDPVPCIHCGWCVEDCPVGLDPSILSQLDATSDEIEKPEHLEVCVDCGLCSHVCPASLPIAETIKIARRRFLDPPNTLPIETKAK